MKTSSKRISFTLLAIVFLMAAIVVYSSLIRSTYSKVKSLRGELASKQESLAHYQNTIKKVENFLSQFQNAQEVQKQVSLILPAHPNGGYFTNQLTELARIDGLDVQALATKIKPVIPAKSGAVSSVGSMSADMKLSGSYAGFKAFLRQLENNMLIIDISEIRVERPQNQTPDALNYTITVQSYYQAK